MEGGGGQLSAAEENDVVGRMEVLGSPQLHDKFRHRCMGWRGGSCAACRLCTRDWGKRQAGLVSGGHAHEL